MPTSNVWPAFAASPDVESAVAYARDGRSGIATRTFSKLYGMAGVRVGFGCARADLVKRMQPFRNNVISIPGARAAVARRSSETTSSPKVPLCV